MKKRIEKKKGNLSGKVSRETTPLYLSYPTCGANTKKKKGIFSADEEEVVALKIFSEEESKL